MNNLQSSHEEDANSCCESEIEAVYNQTTLPVNDSQTNLATTSAAVFTANRMGSYNEERMRRRLQFFFMNPIEKWKAKRKFPYKFFVQVSLL